MKKEKEEIGMIEWKVGLDERNIERLMQGIHCGVLKKDDYLEGVTPGGIFLGGSPMEIACTIGFGDLVEYLAVEQGERVELGILASQGHVELWDRMEHKGEIEKGVVQPVLMASAVSSGNMEMLKRCNRVLKWASQKSEVESHHGSTLREMGISLALAVAAERRQSEMIDWIWEECSQEGIKVDLSFREKAVIRWLCEQDCVEKLERILGNPKRIKEGLPVIGVLCWKIAKSQEVKSWLKSKRKEWECLGWYGREEDWDAFPQIKAKRDEEDLKDLLNQREVQEEENKKIRRI